MTSRITEAQLPPEEAPPDDPSGDYAANLPFAARLKHWLHPFGYDATHIVAIQATICFEAWQIVKAHGATKQADQERKALDNYLSIVNDLFVPAPNNVLDHRFKPLYNVLQGSQNKVDITGKQILIEGSRRGT